LFIYLFHSLSFSFFQVDEAGTEAAAATAAVCCCLSIHAPPIISFVADQPFLWALCGPNNDGEEGQREGDEESSSGGGGGGMPLLFTGVFGGQGGEQAP
jgi:hypothetical protein